MTGASPISPNHSYNGSRGGMTGASPVMFPTCSAGSSSSELDSMGLPLPCSQPTLQAIIKSVKTHNQHKHSAVARVMSSQPRCVCEYEYYLTGVPANSRTRLLN